MTVRRLLILLTVSIAACGPGGSPGPSAVPGSSGALATTGPSGASPSPSAGAFNLPACADPYAQPVSSIVAIKTRIGQTSASLRHVVATSTGTLGFVVSLPERAAPEPEDIGILVGNRAISISLLDDQGEDLTHPIVVTAARATLRAGTEPEVPLAPTVGAAVSGLLIPDMSAHVAITMTLDWTDGCWSYRGTVETIAQVALAATVAACPKAEPGMRAAATAIRQVELRVATVSLRLAAEVWMARYVELDGDTQLGSFEGADFTRAPLVVRVGTTLLVSEAADDLSLGMIEVQAYWLADVLPDPLSAAPESVFFTTVTPHADGSVNVPVPTVKGTYVLELTTHWEAPCLGGYGREWLTIQVT